MRGHAAKHTYRGTALVPHWGVRKAENGKRGAAVSLAWSPVAGKPENPQCNLSGMHQDYPKNRLTMNELALSCGWIDKKHLCG